LQGVIQKMGSNFFVAAFVPAMAFIVCCSIAFDSILPIPFRFLGGTESSLLQSGINLLLFTIILGFTLFSLSTYIYKAFEGYTFILGRDSGLRRSFLRRQLRRFRENKTERIWIEKQIAIIDKKIFKESENLGQETEKWRTRRLSRYYEDRELLYSRQYANALERSENLPPSEELILPTRFGNILRAAELYSESRYGIDAVPLWGRLAHVIPDKGMEKVDDANNQCLFLLNASVLATTFAIICLLASIYQVSALWLYSQSPKLFPLLENGWVSGKMGVFYSFLFVISLAAAWLFYVASLLNVSQYGQMIRTSYDLYRFDLIEALRLELPKTLSEEKQLWRRINYFLAGNEQWEQLSIQEIWEKNPNALDAGFEYCHPGKKTTQDNPGLPGEVAGQT
jgi:hypothetical protein